MGYNFKLVLQSFQKYQQKNVTIGVYEPDFATCSKAIVVGKPRFCIGRR